ncbi:hypothetical protein [Evansella cellulosilytica]|uniref:Uncharacterized protein n=1 Tax=Evansella cellulosilytica (strain ATCC 21833 / DSM 2522 / FERM P-1141 / JCM 9156 / N-4) TaxID=649639 RepID=E6TVI5_EVAC2|nr:hypothetical protein [Evansella cellulosilytica]ADU31002.1 hypothetical protein Bcell_2747 [Evansella cellulosilytica DSM 2522]
MALEYTQVQRIAKQGELVQCKETGDIWSVALTFDNGALIVGDTYDVAGDYDGITMAPHSYWVLKKIDRGTRNINIGK